MSVFLAAFLGAVAGSAALIGLTALYLYWKYRQVLKQAEEEESAALRARFDGMFQARMANLDDGGGTVFAETPFGRKGACDGPREGRMAS